MKPITPEQASATLPKIIESDEIISIINDILLERYDPTDTIVEITYDDIFQRWPYAATDKPFHAAIFDFKPIYRKSGWDVEFVKESNAWETGYDRWEFKKAKV